MPEYLEGEQALKNYIYEKAREMFMDNYGSMPFQDKFTAKIIIERDGSVKYVKMINNKYLIYEKYLADIFRSMPKWKPALWEGQSVRSFMVCHFIIKLMM